MTGAMLIHCAEISDGVCSDRSEGRERERDGRAASRVAERSLSVSFWGVESADGDAFRDASRPNTALP